jgi:hypothetical protein
LLFIITEGIECYMNKLKTLQTISNVLNHITINKEKIPNLLVHKGIIGTHWLEDPIYRLDELSDEEKLFFILILDSTSFSYWGDPNWKITVDSQKINGARGMILALRRAVDQGLLKLNAQFLSTLSREQYRNILQGTTEIPLFEERYQILKKIGAVLLSQCNGDINKFIEESKGDALKLVELLITHFPFFSDKVQYEDIEIYFNKKVQLFVLDISRMDLVSLNNIDQLTACADYKLPQVLRRFGIFEYSKHLSSLVDNHVPLPRESIEEIEIRVKTILLVELIKKNLKKMGHYFQSYEINDLLWLLGQEKNSKDKPYHKTRTTKY